MGSWQKLSSHYGKTAAMIFPPRFQLNLVVTLSPGLRKWGRECIVERQQQENRTGMRSSDQELARDLFGASIFWPPRSRLQWLRCYGGTTEISLCENRNRIFKKSTTIQSIFQLWLCLWKGNDRFWCVLNWPLSSEAFHDHSEKWDRFICVHYWPPPNPPPPKVFMATGSETSYSNRLNRSRISTNRRQTNWQIECTSAPEYSNQWLPGANTVGG